MTRRRHLRALADAAGRLWAMYWLRPARRQAWASISRHAAGVLSPALAAWIEDRRQCPLAVTIAGRTERCWLDRGHGEPHDLEFADLAPVLRGTGADDPQLWDPANEVPTPGELVLLACGYLPATRAHQLGAWFAASRELRGRARDLAKWAGTPELVLAGAFLESCR